MIKNCSLMVRCLLFGLICFMFISVSAGSFSTSETSRPDLSAANHDRQAQRFSEPVMAGPFRKLHNPFEGSLLDPLHDNSLPILNDLVARASAPVPFAPSVTATKTDALAVDVNSNTKADPGDTLMYTITITNSGPDPANNVVFTDTIDTNTTLVAGSVAASPIAVNDSYQTIGNVNIVVPAAQGVILNPNPNGPDLNPNGSGTLTVTMVNATPVPPLGDATVSTAGGSVTLSSDGGFSYTPNAGFRGPTDTFTYTLGNGTGKTDTATVTITINGMIWFVDDNAVAAGANGTLAKPFTCLVGAGCFDPTATDQTGDSIFLFSGNYTDAAALTLLNNQRLIGQGAPDPILTATGLPAPSGNNLLPSTNGADPIITTTSNATAIILGQNNQLHGFTVGDTGTAGTDILGSNIGSSPGLTIKDLTVNGTGQALNLMSGTIVAGSTFVTVESNGGSPAEGVRLNTVGGSFGITTTNIVNPTGTGIDVQSSPSGTSFSFGGTTVNKGGSSGTGVNLASNIGTFSFSSLAVTTSNGTGVSAMTSGTVNVAGGSINATNGPALFVNPTTLGMTFTSVSSSASTTTGVSLTSASGSLSIGSTTVTNPAGIGILVQTLASGGTVGFGTTSVTNPDANTTGNTGVRLIDNVGNVSFGDLDTTPESGQRGLHATGNTGTITSASGTIVAVSNTAVEIVGPSAASRTPLNMTLTMTSATGAPSNGILLTNVNGPGGSVGFVVTGGSSTSVGGDASGGTISNVSGADGATSGNGVYIENADEVTLRRITINGTNQNHGIRGINSSNITLEFLTVTGTNGTSTGLDEGSVNFDNLASSAAITSCLIEGGLEENLNVVNTSGTLNRLTVTGTTFGLNNSTSGNNNILIESQNPGTTLNFTLQSSIIKGARADWISATNNTNSTMDLVIGGDSLALGNTFSNLGADVNPGAAAGGNRILHAANGPSTYKIKFNNTKGSKGTAIRVNAAQSLASMSGRIENNVVGVQATANSGSSEGSGISAESTGGGDHTTSIGANNVFQYNNHGILLQAGDQMGSPVTFQASVTNNTVSNPGNINADFNGFHLNNGTVGTDNFTSCIDISNNNFTGAGQGTVSPNNNDIRLRHRQGTTIQLPGYTGPARDNTDSVVDEVTTHHRPAGSGGLKNNLFGTGTANSVSTGGGFVNSPGGAACAAPSVLSIPVQFALSSAQSDTARVEPLYRDILFAPEANSTSGRALSVRQIDLLIIAQAAIARLEQLGVSGEDLERLKAVQFEIADLPDDQLAITTPTKVTIDETGADYDWFIDATPDENEEFDRNRAKQLKAKELGYASGRMDLLTVVTRSLDYVLEHDWWSPSINRIDLMQQTLPSSTRRVPVGTVTRPRPLPEPVKQVSIITPALVPATVVSPDRNPVASAAKAYSGETGQGLQLGETQTPEPAATAEPLNSTSVSPLPVTPAVFNSAFNQTPTFGQNVKTAAMRIESASGGGLYRANNARRVAAFTPLMAGETVNLNLGTIPAGESVQIMFSVTINTPVTPPGTIQVCNQGTVSGSNFSNVLTDDPDVAGSANPTCTPLALADLEITAKDDAPAIDVPAGSNITYTINFRNNGPDVAHNVRVTDPIPANTTFVSATVPAGWTRIDAVNPGDGPPGVITFAKATAANAETASFTIVVQVGAATPGNTTITNTASTTSDTPEQAATLTNNSKTATTNVTAQADLSITKTNGTTTEIPGTTTTYTIVVTNNGPNLVTGATVSDTFPAALTGVTFTSVVTGGATGNTASGSGNINDTVTMPVGSTITYTVTGTINPVATGSLSNTATVAVPVGVTDPVPANNSATDTDTLTPQGDLLVTKTNGTTTEIPGTTTTYTIVVSTSGPSTATGATVADTFPATLTGVTFTSVAAGGATGNTASGSGNINDTVTLPPGSSITYTATGTIDAAATGSLSNTATVTAPGGFTDPTPANNSATDTDTLTPQGDLSITKTNGTTTEIPGTSTTYTIVVTNNGPSNVTGAVVADTFPATLSGVTFTSTTTGTVSGNTASGSGNINDTVNMAAGATITYMATGTIDAAATGTLSNTATVTAPAGFTDPTPGNNSATDTDTLSGEGDLSITKTNGTTSEVPGTTTTYTIVVSYTGVSNVTGAVVADMFPAALTGVTFTSVTTGTVSGNMASGSGNINDTVNMTSGSSITYTVTGTIDPGAAGSLSNTATVTAPAGFTDTNAANNSATDTDTLAAQGDISITKTNGTTTEIPGTTTTYTIVVSNTGPSSAVGAGVSDMFPASLTGVTFTSVAAGGATGNTASGMGNINDTVNLLPGSSITYTATGTIDPAATGSLSNTANVTPPAGFTDASPGNNSATDTDTLSVQGDLSITKTNGTTSEVPGTTTTYTIVVTNSGPSNAIGATVADTFPASLTGVTFTSIAAGGATGNTATGSGNINDTVDMPAGSTITYTVTGTIDPSATGTLSNTATVTAPGGFTDTNTGNNSATDTDTLGAEADLSITKTNGTASEVPGTTTTYTIVVTNGGPSNVSGATVTDSFPAILTGVTFTSVTTGTVSGNTAAGSGNINDTVNMTAGSTITYTVTGTIVANSTGSLSNTATVTAPAGTADPNTANNSATDSDTLTPEGDLSITKTNGTTTEVPGTTTTYTIVVTNGGPSNVTGAVVADTFPAQLTGVTFTSTTTGTVSGNTASGSGNINNTVNMSAGATITYIVTGTIIPSATGSLSNTATVTPPAGFTDANPGNNSATDTDTLTPQSDLSVTKTDSPDPVAAGTNLTYTISLANTGPSNAQNVSLSDSIPPNTTFQSAMVMTGTGWVIAPLPPVDGSGVVTFTKASMAAGESAMFKIVVKVIPNPPPNTTITNTATVTTSTTDPNAGNNSATATTAVLTFDKCVRDDATGRVLRWNSITGSYEFIDPSKNNLKLTGTGVATALSGGCKFELNAVAGKNGNMHFVFARVNVCTKAGVFQFRENGGATLIGGNDADVTNNNCNIP